MKVIIVDQPRMHTIERVSCTLQTTEHWEAREFWPYLNISDNATIYFVGDSGNDNGVIYQIINPKEVSI